MPLTIALERVDFLPPTRVTDNASILTLKSLVFEPLCGWAAGRVTPALFGAWQSDAAARRWQFRLRPDARFHDDAPCRSGDVRAFLDGILGARDMFGMPWSYARYFQGARFATPASDRLTVECETPFADMPEVFAEFFISRPDARGEPVLGTGPYRVEAWTAGEEAWLQPVAGGRALHVRAIASAEARLAALRSGKVAVACGLEQMHKLPDFGADLAWARQVSTLSVMAYLNAARGAFVDPRVRLAANLAVDRSRIVTQLFGDLAWPAATVVSPFHFGFDRSGCMPVVHDPERARRLLDAAAPGRAIRLRTPTFMPERAPEIARMVADQLGAVGFAVTVDIEPDRPEYAREIGRKEMGDAALFDSSPHSTFRVLDDKISSVARGVWWQGHEDAQVDALLAEARGTADDHARAGLYGRCLARLREAPPWIYLLHPTLVSAWRPNAGRFTLDHRGVLGLGGAPGLTEIAG